MKREEIINKIIGLLNKKLDSLKDSLKETEISVKEAPSAMESHSDTSRFQFGQLADNLRILIGKIERVIKEIEKDVKLSENVGNGSIVKINKDGQEIYYFVSLMGLEEPLSIKGKEFKVISADSLIGKSLFGRKVGENVEIKISSGSYFVKIMEVN